MSAETPHVVVLAGPNGAGKTTASAKVLRDRAHIAEFVNADIIAQGLSGFDPDRAAIAAGRIMLARLDELAEQRASFAFETTLASRTFAPRLRNLIESGYEFHLVYFWLPHPDLAVMRVAKRVALGGHFVPAETIHRRYHAGLRNFFSLYQTIATTWQMYDNTEPTGPVLIAAGARSRVTEIGLPHVWNVLRERYDET